MKIGFHTDAFNSSYWSFDQCLDWAEKNDVHFIECGVIDGVSWIHGLGYHPHVALYEDPVLLRRKMESHGVRSMHRLGITPTMFGLEYSYDWLDSMPEMAAPNPRAFWEFAFGPETGIVDPP